MESLESLLKSLYLISGLNMSLFDINGNLLASYPHQKCPFCHALSKNPEALSHCTASDLQAIEHVKREEKIYIYQCHFHLYEGNHAVILLWKPYWLPDAWTDDNEISDSSCSGY